MHPAPPVDAAPALPVWRLVETPSLHVGLRPAASWGDGLGITVQVTLRTPW